VLRAVNASPVEIQDMCPSDTRFKLLVFTGDIQQPAQLTLLRRFAEEIKKTGSALARLGSDAFDMITIIKGEKECVNHLDVPVVLRAHFNKCARSLLFSCHWLLTGRSMLSHTDIVILALVMQGTARWG
jgi:phenol 2-monooxygenase (NADPH)